MSPTPAIALTPGAEINGFRLHSATEVPEVRSVAYLLEHPASGARLLHLHTADPENLFSVTFPTPSSDDTGCRTSSSTACWPARAAFRCANRSSK